MNGQSLTNEQLVINKTPKSEEQVKKAAKLIANGSSIRSALLASGWSEKKANKGKAALTRPLIAALAKQGTHLRDLGRQSLADPNAMHELAVGRTAYAALTGDSKGLDAAKQLGSHKSVNCWQPDTITAIQVNLSTLEALEDDSLIKTK